jgi:hypothetical protein
MLQGVFSRIGNAFLAPGIQKKSRPNPLDASLRYECIEYGVRPDI